VLIVTNQSVQGKPQSFKTIRNVSKAIPLAATRLTSKTGDGYRQVEFLVEFLATTIADSAHARVDRQHQRTEKPR
jgi:hypothetical protein